MTAVSVIIKVLRTFPKSVLKCLENTFRSDDGNVENSKNTERSF